MKIKLHKKSIQEKEKLGIKKFYAIKNNWNGKVQKQV